MLMYSVICLVAFLVAALTLFSGFGLGTLLMPAFALFFPLPVAIAATALVHLANNLFKVALVARKADWRVVLQFGLPGAVAALAGALLLSRIGAISALASYTLGGRAHEVTLVKVLVGGIIIGFAIIDLLPQARHIAVDRQYLPLGGALSGFFGGLSGNQGALRSAFLIKAGLSKEAFVSTGVVAGVMVDIARLIVYGMTFYTAQFATLAPGMDKLLLAAIGAAFVGSFLGTRLLKKVTLQTVHIIVGILLIAIGLGMIAGLI